MKRFAILLLMATVTAHGEVASTFIWVSKDEVKCAAFKPEYQFFEGCRGVLGDPVEAFMRLVAVQGESKYMLNTRTGLVDFVTIKNGQQALDFVRLFSRKETHYLFDDADFLELPAYKTGSAFWYNNESAKRARDAGVPIDNPPVHVNQTNGAYRITRYAMDWHRNILRVVETIGTNGAYRISNRKIVARDIWALMPMYE